MRGTDDETGSLFSYQSPESMVPADHPFRVIRTVVKAALARLSPEFSQLYSPYGRASIAPEKLLRALLVQAFFGVRSERQLMEQVRYNMLFRWFIGLSMDAPVWDVTVFTKNRDRLLEGDIARSFLLAILADPKVKSLLSDEHFSVDGTMIEAWAELARDPARRSLVGWPAEGGMKSFQPKDGSGPSSDPDEASHPAKQSLAGWLAGAATANVISEVRSGRTRRIDRRPTRRRASTARAMASQPSSAISATS